jgi:hypothetical protein
MKEFAHPDSKEMEFTDLNHAIRSRANRPVAGPQVAVVAWT